VPQPAAYKINNGIMILNELWERSPEAYQNVAQDNSQPRLGDLRKTKLTLKQINKLRQLNDVRSYEFKQKLDKVQRQYAPAVEPMV
jgi:hypothetical protein